MGHSLETTAKLGELMEIQIDAKNKLLIGAADSSSTDGAAVGY